MISIPFTIILSIIILLHLKNSSSSLAREEKINQMGRKYSKFSIKTNIEEMPSLNIHYKTPLYSSIALFEVNFAPAPLILFSPQTLST